MEKKADPSTLGFEEALAGLEEIVQAIERGDVGLEDSIKQYERGMGLIRRCRAILAEAELKVQRLQLDEAGQLKPEPIEPPEEPASQH